MKVNCNFEYKKYKGKENMDLDLWILDNAIKNKSKDFFLRFYGWEPKCVTLGRNQKEFQTDEKIDIVRRPTGGRALLHDNEITYSITGKIPEKQSVIETYTMISKTLINAFKKLGVELEIAGEKKGDKKYCMNISSGADICFKSKKFIGSAQFRKEGYFLQHGSILKDIDTNLLEKIFNEKIDINHIITLKQIKPDLDDETIIETIKKEFINEYETYL